MPRKNRMEMNPRRTRIRKNREYIKKEGYIEAMKIVKNLIEKKAKYNLKVGDSWSKKGNYNQADRYWGKSMEDEDILRELKLEDSQ